MAGNGSAVAEQSFLDPKFEGLNPDTADIDESNSI